MPQSLYGGGGCGCAKPAPVKINHGKAPGSCEVVPVQESCMQPVDGCMDLHIIQGEDLSQKLCFLKQLSKLKCLYPEGRVQTIDNLCLNVPLPQSIRLGCVEGCGYSNINTLHTVTAVSADGKDMTLDSKLAIDMQRCWEQQITNAPGCTIVPPEPPIAMSHIDPSNWILEGSISTRRANTQSRKDFGVKLTPGSSEIYYTLDRKVFVGDQVVIYLPNQTIKAKAVRVRCDEISQCGELVKATFVELDMAMPGSVDPKSCYLAKFDAGNLINLNFSLTKDQCWNLELPWSLTQDIPVIENCDDETVPTCGDKDARYLGQWDVFAMVPSLVGSSLKIERIRVATGNAYVHPTNAGYYSL